MAGLSREYTNQLLTAVKQPTPALKGAEGSRITVNETISTFSFLYEKIRNAVDYKDEHLIRKAAILRILKRQLILESEPDVIADRLIRELIGAKYLPNGVLSESLIYEVSARIRKLQAVLRVNAGSERHMQWLRGISAVEVEEVLVDATTEKAFVTFLYERLADSVCVRGTQLDETERRLQVYVACYRSLVKADDEMLGFKLLRAYLPEWMRAGEWLDAPRPIAERLVAIERRIEGRLHHPLAQRFLQAVKPWAVSLGILRDVMLEKPSETPTILQKPDVLKVHVARRIEERYALAKGKLRRGTWRAMLYLFVTKMLVAFVLEVPVELVWYAEVNLLSLGINLSFPPLLMFLVGLLIHIPGQENADRIQAGVTELLSDGPIPVRYIRSIESRSGITGFLFSLAYACTFLLSFGLVMLLLHFLDFTWISGAIFIFFLCVVSFFAFRLRTAAREVIVIEHRQRLMSVLVDFLSLPILRAGRWLSRSISRLNVFLFIFDFIFEAPFKLFLAVLEEWFAFLKEKKDELQ